jgi:hypothetical protein
MSKRGRGILGGPGPYFASIHRSAWKKNSANFVLKPSEKSHEGAKRLTIRRLIAT